MMQCRFQCFWFFFIDKRGTMVKLKSDILKGRNGGGARRQIPIWAKTFFHFVVPVHRFLHMFLVDQSRLCNALRRMPAHSGSHPLGIVCKWYPGPPPSSCAPKTAGGMRCAMKPPHPELSLIFTWVSCKHRNMDSFSWFQAPWLGWRIPHTLVSDCAVMRGNWLVVKTGARCRTLWRFQRWCWLLGVPRPCCYHNT